MDCIVNVIEIIVDSGEGMQSTEGLPVILIIIKPLQMVIGQSALCSLLCFFTPPRQGSGVLQSVCL